MKAPPLKAAPRSAEQLSKGRFAGEGSPPLTAARAECGATLKRGDSPVKAISALKAALRSAEQLSKGENRR